MSTQRSVFLLAMVPFLFAAKCRNQPETNPDTGTPVVPLENELQISSIEPRRVEAGQGFRARILGTGFQDGATVRVGAEELNTVVFVSENSLVGNVGLLDPGGYDVRVTNPDGTTAVLRAGIIVESVQPTVSSECRSTRIFFDLDSTTINDDARSILADKMTCFTTAGVSIRLDGHCDERGTTDYNIALGQRRSDIVKRYLVAQGVPTSRISTNSYGEERPLVNASNEEAWSQNRRVEITITE